MLSSMRKYSRSFIIYIFFGIIIAVFVINFGPQSAGVTAAPTDAASVEGIPIQMNDFSYALTVSGARARGTTEAEMIQARGFVMDQLILRSLMANHSRELGIRIPDQEIQDMLFKGRYLALGRTQFLRNDEEEPFDYDHFSQVVRFHFGLSVKKFQQQQQEELLAEKFRQLLRTTTKISIDEAKADFVHKNTKVELSYVRFSPDEFKTKVTLDETKINSFLEKEKEKLKKEFETKKTAYLKTPKQVDLQVLKINFQGARQKSAATRKINELLKKIKKGTDFGVLASSESDDKESKLQNGLLGWRSEKDPELGESVAKALANLKNGQISDVIEEKDHFILVKVRNRREGDLTFDQVAQELAQNSLVKTESIRLAKETAEDFIKRAKAGEALADMFTVEDDSAKEDETEKEKTAKVDDDRSPLKLQTTTPFSRSDQHLIPDIGISQDLTNDAFKMKEGEIASKAYQVGDAIYLVACKTQTNPDMKDWEKRQHELIEEFSTQKWAEKIREYAQTRCLDALKNEKIQVRMAVIAPPTEAGKKTQPIEYTPCSSFVERF